MATRHKSKIKCNQFNLQRYKVAKDKPNADHVNGKQKFPLSRKHTCSKIGQRELAEGTGRTHTEKGKVGR